MYGTGLGILLQQPSDRQCREAQGAIDPTFDGTGLRGGGTAMKLGRGPTPRTSVDTLQEDPGGMRMQNLNTVYELVRMSKPNSADGKVVPVV